SAGPECHNESSNAAAVHAVPGSEPLSRYFQSEPRAMSVCGPIEGGGGGAAAVTTDAVFEYAELVALSKARTRYEYDVPAASVASLYDVAFAASCAICANAVQDAPVQRSTLNPDSVVELSVHVRF